jgi:tetratricopeptide (TPR) repeat protein
MDLDTRYRALLEQGLQASREQRGQAAIELFALASDLSPGEGMPHFLMASEHAAEGRIEAAERAFANAVLLAPAFHLARYQLGLLQFSSERAGAALVTWQPLLDLPEGQPLGHFVRGFAALARDGFEAALQQFQRGLAHSEGQPALAGDIERVVAAVQRLLPPTGAAPALPESAADHVLVSGYARGLH